MGFPLKTEYKAKDPIAKLSASDLETICNMLNLLSVEVDENAERASVVTPQQNGKGWKIVIPAAGAGSGLPSNANKSKWMVPIMSDDNATAVDDPDLWTVDWIRAHA